MTASELREAGMELFGEHWQQPLAALLRVNPRTLRRWSSGQNAIPESVVETVEDLLAVSERVAEDKERVER
jgi:hypothetical protein